MTDEVSVMIDGLPNLYKSMVKAGQQEEANKLMAEHLLNTFSIDISKKIERYVGFGNPPLIPADLPYFELYHELKQVYINGLYYSSIVMAGVLVERICYEKLSENLMKIGEHKLSFEEKRDIVFHLGLSHQIDLIYECGLIKKTTRTAMVEINNLRNNYVHPKNTNADAEKDSKKALKHIKKIMDNEYAIKTKNIKDYAIETIKSRKTKKAKQEPNV